MWKLLPIMLLVSCAANEQRGDATNEEPSNGPRIVNTTDLVLDPSSKSGSDDSAVRKFHGIETRGSLDETGAWNLSTAVTHNRLRCATYETGIRLGKGNPACTQVEWLTETSYGSNRKHCNSAVLIHKGSGKFADGNDVYQASSCVRVVTKCTGAC